MRVSVAILLSVLSVSTAEVSGLSQTVDGPEGQGAKGFELMMEFERPGLPVPHWKIQFVPDGTGTYIGWPAKAGAAEVKREFHLSDTTRVQLRSLLDASNGMKPCETHIRGLADMGKKSLRYAPVAGTDATCSFNYTENKPLHTAADMLLGIAFMIEEGQKLEQLHRFDRLGLDAEMQSLEKAVAGGQAVDPGIIADTLRSLVKDESLMNRVRSRAVKLLQDAGVSQGF